MGIPSNLRDAVLSIALALAAPAAVGCGDDEPEKTTPRRDSGPERDASEPEDAALPRDAGMVPDTGSPDEGLVGSCAIDANKIFSVTQRNEPFVGALLAVDPVQSMFALPYVGPQAGCLDVVNVTMIKGGSQGGDPTTMVAFDECALIKETTALSLNRAWLVATVDSRQPPFDVWVQRYDPAQGELGDAVRVSNAAAVETALAMTTLRSSQNALIAWADESTEGNSVNVRVLGPDGSVSGEPVRIDESSTLRFRGLSLAPLGTEGAAGLAYWRYSSDFTTSQIVFRPLAANGAPTRDAWVLASNAGPAASVDLTTDPTFGGVVYSVAEGSQGRQVWFQRIDDTGQAAAATSGPGRSPALRVVDPPYKGIDVAVAKLRAGYVIAYRALPAANEPRAEIRLFFLDRNGAVIGESDVAYTSEAGGRVAIEAANDGRVVIGWSQVNSDGKSELKLVRLPCLGG